MLSIDYKSPIQIYHLVHLNKKWSPFQRFLFFLVILIKVGTGQPQLPGYHEICFHLFHKPIESSLHLETNLGSFSVLIPLGLK